MPERMYDNSAFFGGFTAPIQKGGAFLRMQICHPPPESLKYFDHFTCTNVSLKKTSNIIIKLEKYTIFNYI